MKEKLSQSLVFDSLCLYLGLASVWIVPLYTALVPYASETSISCFDGRNLGSSQFEGRAALKILRTSNSGQPGNNHLASFAKVKSKFLKHIGTNMDLDWMLKWWQKNSTSLILQLNKPESRIYLTVYEQLEDSRSKLWRNTSVGKYFWDKINLIYSVEKY